MATWKPDSTFYPSPRSAAAGPREELAYVVTLNEAGNYGAAPAARGDAKPDAVTVVDLNPDSSDYGKVVSRLDMPNVGDELHHFGWNACSSALSRGRRTRTSSGATSSCPACARRACT